MNVFIFVVLPYAALALVLFVTPYRYFANRLTWSAYSTQFLEQKALYWGSNAWHYGIIPVLVAHLAGIVAPGPMKALLGDQKVLILLEDVGQGFALLALFGGLVLLVRRLGAPILAGTTSAGDWALLVLLIAEVATGVYMGIVIRGGPLWYLYTAVPYFHSLLVFNPRIEYMVDFPLVFKLHAAGAFLIVAVLPFTRLVHLLYLPIRFLADPPILYRWRSRKSG
jgi:nitrate reductase gamma subunit